MSWIKVRESLIDDPRLRSLGRTLHCKPETVAGYLLRAWIYFGQHTTDGRISDFTARDFDKLTGRKGLAGALTSIGWLEVGSNFVRFLRWEEHNGEGAKRRAKDAARKAALRAAPRIDAHALEAPASTREGNYPPEVRDLSASDADTARTRTEKRRTEKTTQQQDACAVVAELLGSTELLDHENATDERVAWIAEQAPSKNNPGGWAAQAIREGYAPPEDWDDKRAKRDLDEHRDEYAARVRAMAEGERAGVFDRLLAMEPAFARQERDPPSQMLIGAAAWMLMADNGFRPPKWYSGRNTDLLRAG